MRYKIRVFHINTNEETIILNEVFESKKATENAIRKFRTMYPDKYDYVKVPIK
ncbi:hypothetical protein NDK43_26555 [Neobacillus pocheonensis]|uniref:Phage protein n=1 Tax=Neobacillus pocheonensis TaxID=363869 RepID=A0ABT0WIA3_9BACI|nr:hypothetical protein [Neobacillus pocheonensis]